MIAFATLLLGLVAGEVRIDLLVSDSARAVELRVDGALCARLTAPPWSAWCDFGDELAPHRLLATAFDGEGREIARAEQRLNVDARDAEIALVIEHDPASGRSLLRLATASPEAAAPRSLTVTVDGHELTVRDAATVELPKLELAEPHLVHVEATWSDRVTAATDAVFGGTFGGRLTTELVAVPIHVDGRRTPAPAELAGAIRRAGVPLTVAAVERGLGEVWVVADPQRLPELARRVGRPSGPMRPPGRPSGNRDARLFSAIGGLDWRFVGSLTTAERLRIVWPWPERRVAGERAYELFLPSPASSLRDGLPWLLYHARLPPRGEGAPRLADAVAVAGLSLAGTERRRAILLLLGEADDDASQVAPQAVRRYLERLRVPLHVWRLERRAGGGDDPWGATLGVTSSRELEVALRALRDDLTRQRIVWLQGSHLPHEIELDEELAAAREPRRDGGSEALDGGLDGGASAADAEDGEALARALAAGAAERRAAVAQALGDDAVEFRQAGVTLRVERGVSLDLAALSRALDDGAARWSAATGHELPPLAGVEIAVVARLADHPHLAGATSGLAARGHAAHGVAVLESAGRPADEVAALARHELAHLLAERAWRRPLPVWLEEGLAEMLARTRPATSGGAPEARRGEITRRIESGGVRTEARGPLADLLDLARAAERGQLPAIPRWTGLSWREFVAPERRAWHYALAGELTTFLLTDEGPRRDALRGALARAAGDGELDLETELAAAVGDATALDTEFRVWLVAERDRALASGGGPP